MKKWVKWLIILGVIFFVVIPLCLLITAWIFIDPIGKQLIQSGGTAALGVKTEVGSFHCSIIGGSVAIQKMTIDDPPGFDPSKKTFSMGQVATGVSIGSLSSDTIEIKELDIEDLRLYLEANASTSNVQAIMANVNGGGSAAPQPGQPAQPAPAQPAGPEKRFKIGLIKLKNIGMDIHVTAPVELKTSVTIPPFEMHDIWKADGTGYTAGELITEILNRTTKAGLDVGGKDLQGLIKDRLMAEMNKAGDKLKQAASDAAKQATSQAKEDLTKGATDLLNNAAQGKTPADSAKDAGKDAGKTLKDDLTKVKSPFK